MAVKKAFFMFNLKPDKKVEDYIAWTKAVNGPEAVAIKSITAFHDYISVGSLRGAPIAYQFVEEITVSDFDQYAKDLADPGHAASAQTWRDFVSDFFVVLTEQIQ